MIAKNMLDKIIEIYQVRRKVHLRCVSDVRRAAVQGRIDRTVSQRVRPRLGVGKRLLPGVLLLLVALGREYGLTIQAVAQAESNGKYVYEVASIKRNKSVANGSLMRAEGDALAATGVTVKMLVQNAYGIQYFQIAGAPSWVDSEKYDIEAKIDSRMAEELEKLDPAQRRLERQRMLQVLLADRFQLKVHRESRDVPVYALVIAKNGSKLREAHPGDTYEKGLKGPDGHGGAGLIFMEGNGGPVTGQGVPISNLVHLLSVQLGRPVIDKTALTGIYDFTLKWSPEQSAPMSMGTDGAQPRPDQPQADSSGPSIFTAIQEQLGLKLESQKGPAEMVVIDHVERPSEN
jgi:uncharacterized protein (TIGR03435 family)